MTRYEQFIMIVRRTAGTLGVALLIGWILLLTVYQLYRSATHEPEEDLKQPDPPPPVMIDPPACVEMENGIIVCDQLEKTDDV